MEKLLKEIRKCTLCASQFSHAPNPILQASSKSQLLIIGQAPGSKVHKSGVPWEDASGDRLRSWLGITDEEFYNADNTCLLPMGFCYPGKGKSGDLPPSERCAPEWHKKVLDKIKTKPFTIVIGQYAQNRYFGNKNKKTLTETVKNYKEYLPEYLPLPHPSPRNNIWLKKNPWFEKEVIPILQKEVKKAIK